MPSLFPFTPTSVFLLGLDPDVGLSVPTARAVFVPSLAATAGAYRIHAHAQNDTYPEIGAREGQQVFDLNLTDFLPLGASVTNLPAVIVSQRAPDDALSDASVALLQGTVIDGLSVHVILGGATTATRAVPGASYTITAQVTASTGQDFEIVTDPIYCPADS